MAIAVNICEVINSWWVNSEDSIESWDGLGWNKTLKIIHFPTPAVGSETFH